MDGRDFLTLARKFLTAETDAAACRTAISRAYYAAYNEAATFLDSLGFEVPEGPQGHGQAQFRLNNANDPKLSMAASRLSDLKKERVKADYRRKDRRKSKSPPLPKAGSKSLPTSFGSWTPAGKIHFATTQSARPWQSMCAKTQVSIRLLLCW